jgi:hypothetical protein
MCIGEGGLIERVSMKKECFFWDVKEFGGPGGLPFLKSSIVTTCASASCRLDYSIHIRRSGMVVASPSDWDNAVMKSVLVATGSFRKVRGLPPQRR